jgi:polar amino acid transport system substrate-binding protein
VRNFFNLVRRSSALLLLGVAGCATPQQEGSSGPLKIGVTPDHAPLIYMERGRVSGMEVDFGRALGLELKRPVQFVNVPWDQQLDALASGMTDIIMSGMTITRNRRLQAAFSNPYLVSGMRALVRRGEVDDFDSAEKIQQTSAAVGATAGTTAELFIKKHCPEAKRKTVARRNDVAGLLAKGAMDLYVDEGFAVAEILASDDSKVSVLPVMLTRESYAWAVRPADTDLLAEVNRILAKWDQDGTIPAVIDHWMPNLKKIQDR